MNPDGLAYCRGAEHLADLSPDLAVSAVWGPLQALLMAPMVACGAPSPVVALVVQGAAGLALVWMVGQLADRLAIPPWVRDSILVALALRIPDWATQVIAPDLLLSVAVVGFLWETADRDRPGRGWWLRRAGWILALLLAKPVGLPLAIALALGAAAAGARAGAGAGEARRALGSLGRDLAWIAAVWAAWALVLTGHYGRPTLGRSVEFETHFLAPWYGALWSQPSFATLHLPRAGRTTSWEDPMELTGIYRAWDPLGSEEAKARTRARVERNLRAVLAEAVALDGLGLVPLAALLVMVPGWFRPRPDTGFREVLPGLPVLALGLAYLPSGLEARYLWPAWGPALLGGALLFERLGGSAATTRGSLRGLLALSLLATPGIRGMVVLAEALAETPRSERAVAGRIARSVRAAGGIGPVVSWTGYASKGSQLEGVLLAWELGVPWLGHLDDRGLDLPEASRMGARWLVTKQPVGRPRPEWLRDRVPVHAEDLSDESYREGRVEVFRIAADPVEPSRRAP